MILSAQTIRKLGIITPCIAQTRYCGVTYGLSSAGYDLRTAKPVRLKRECPQLVDAIETFRMPHNVIGFLYTKSTWAREHVRVANTVVEPGWKGVLRLELSIHIDTTLVLPEGIGIAQVVFQYLDEPTEQPYEGKYQNQKPGTDAIFA